MMTLRIIKKVFLSPSGQNLYLTVSFLVSWSHRALGPGDHDYRRQHRLKESSPITVSLLR